MYERHSQQNQRWGSKSIWVLIGFIAVAAFFLLTEHRAHLLGALPYLLLLACPFMHMFMHGGHGHHHGGDDTQGRQDRPDQHGHSAKRRKV